MDVSDAIHVAIASDRGLIRTLNQDAALSDLSTGLVIVADGMGGHNSGEIASQMATQLIQDEMSSLIAQQKNQPSQVLSIAAILQKAVKQTNDIILETALTRAGCEGMGTTLVSGVFADNKIVIGHIGDSRMYRLRNDDFVQLTEDHSLVQAQINAGLMTKDEARYANNKHLVTRALGTTSEVALELNEYEVLVGDIYLLCSDGLTDLVDDHDIKKTIINANRDIGLAVNALIGIANARGGKDNISTLIALVDKPFPLA
jgi:protein phosphatase